METQDLFLAICHIPSTVTCHHHTPHPYRHINLAALLHHAMLHQSAWRIMQPCTMWYLQECEHALYLPPIFSWLAALATLSRLLRDFSSGSAIFPLNLGPLVLSFSSCPPFPSSLYVPFLLLPGFPLCLPHTHTIPPPSPPALSLPLPDSSSLTHTQTHSSFAHTAVVTQTGIHLTLILSLSLPPSLLLSRIRQGGAEPL